MISADSTLWHPLWVNHSGPGSGSGAFLRHPDRVSKLRASEVGWPSDIERAKWRVYAEISRSPKTQEGIDHALLGVACNEPALRRGVRGRNANAAGPRLREPRINSSTT